MGSIITRMIQDKVSRPVAIITGGEMYWTNLPTDDTLSFIVEATGGRFVQVVDTKVDIDCWYDDEYLYHHIDAPNPLATAFALGGQSQLLHGPVVLTGTSPDGATIPLNERQMEFLIQLAARAFIPISTIR